MRIIFAIMNKIKNSALKGLTVLINNSWRKLKRRNECLINVCKSDKDLSW
jgi:hypothetical protein